MQMEQKSLNSNLELWGGIECTINRIDDVFFDQLEYSGHYYRENDISLIAESGIKTLRYPILWERHQPLPNQQIDWSWATQKRPYSYSFYN